MISFISFKCEALGKQYKFIRLCKNTPDVFFFSVILYLLTFIMAMYLRDIKFSTFFPTQVRSKLSNFGVVITISIMVLLDYLTGLDTPKLHVPDEFHVKTFINIFKIIILINFFKLIQPTIHDRLVNISK